MFLAWPAGHLISGFKKNKLHCVFIGAISTSIHQHLPSWLDFHRRTIPLWHLFLFAIKQRQWEAEMSVTWRFIKTFKFVIDLHLIRSRQALIYSWSFCDVHHLPLTAGFNYPGWLVINATWRCRKHFSQWQRSFYLKAASPLDKRHATMSDSCRYLYRPPLVLLKCVSQHCHQWLSWYGVPPFRTKPLEHLCFNRW